ncbi:MAG: DNA-directed DNA polymerase II small subunit [Candidatus Anstonellales archaeon]
MNVSRLLEKGVRVELDAEELINGAPADIIERLLELHKDIISKEDALRAIEGSKLPKVEVVERSEKRPIAAEYDAEIQRHDQFDVTGKNTGRGEVEDFVGMFRNRYERLARLLRGKTKKYEEMSLEDAKKAGSGNATVIVMITDIRPTKKGNTMLVVEDQTSSFIAIVPSRDEVAKKLQNIVVDDVVALEVSVKKEFLIVEDIWLPDLRIKEKKLGERDLAVAYISDIHFGSSQFLSSYFDRFTRWLNLQGEKKELAEKVKYIVVAGDVVDGVGIYPEQEKELSVKTIEGQYGMFNSFIEAIPDYIEVIVLPGNHDAGRRAEPQESLKDYVDSRVVAVGNPSFVSIDGFKHLLYHGTGMDSVIAAMPNMTYMHPEGVMVEMLKHRHLSPIYGTNPIYPNPVDYLVIEDEPDIFHAGHVHRNASAEYRGTRVINSGTFQGITDFQIKMGHVPTPGIVYINELKYNELKVVRFDS